MTIMRSVQTRLAETIYKYQKDFPNFPDSIWELKHGILRRSDDDKKDR